jgi:quinol monooxygenase YgiN
MPPRTAKKSLRRGQLKATGTRSPKDAITLTVVLRAKEGQEAALEKELRALVAPTRREAGCLDYTLLRSADQSGVFLLHEIWASREHHTRHTQTPHFERWSSRKDSLLASRDASFWNVVV